MVWLACLIACLWPLAAQADRLDFAAEGGSPQPLVIYGVLDAPQMRPLLEAFHRQAPDLTIEYHNLDTMALHERVLDERAAPRADVIMSPAMPWQYQLANAGLSAPVDSPVAAAWPRWARWRQELFGITFEPVVMVYRRDLATHMRPPESHADLLELLSRYPQALRGRITTYDPRRSGAGYTYAIEDAGISARYWELVEALGNSRSKLETTTSAMLEGLSDGRYWIGYNLIGSYAQAYVAEHPELVMVVPRDYALVLQRLAMVMRDAPHPAAARRFLDYLLSEPAQRLLATATPLGAVHPAIEGTGTAAALRERLGDAIRPVEIGPGLLATLDRLKRRTLLQQWRQAFAGDAAPPVTPAAEPFPLDNSEETAAP